MIYYRNNFTDVLVNLARVAEVYRHENRVMADLGNGRKFPMYIADDEEEATEIFEQIVEQVRDSVTDTLITVGGK